MNPSNWFRNPIAEDNGRMRMSQAANAQEPASLSDELSSRYQALIRLGEAIRSHPDEKDLFQSLANELHEVVEFDAFCQFDCTANWLQWYFVEPYKSGLEAQPLEPVPKEETAAWWVYQNQQPVVARLSNPDSGFPCMRDGFVKLGPKSSRTLPLSTAHRGLGSLGFASPLEGAYSPDEQCFLS